MTPKGTARRGHRDADRGGRTSSSTEPDEPSDRVLRSVVPAGMNAP